MQIYVRFFCICHKKAVSLQHFYVPAKSCARHVLGISGMKKELLTLLACAALLFSGCKQNEPARQLATTDLVGTWGVSSIQTPFDENTQYYGVYYQFLEDGTFFHFAIMSSSTSHVRVDLGTYSISENTLLLTNKETRYFIEVQDVPRLVMDNINDEFVSQYTFTSVSEKLMEEIYQENILYWHRVSSVPKQIWPEEFSYLPLDIETSSLIKQWDMISYFTFSSGETQWGYTYYPKQSGICLLSMGLMTNCYFWVDWVGSLASISGAISQDDYVSVYDRDCSWSLNGNVITMTCSQYTAYKLTQSGLRTDERTITPTEPITADFTVISLTNGYLVLYSAMTGIYYAFVSDQYLPASAPAKEQRNSSPRIKELPLQVLDYTSN